MPEQPWYQLSVFEDSPLFYIPSPHFKPSVSQRYNIPSIATFLKRETWINNLGGDKSLAFQIPKLRVWTSFLLLQEAVTRTHQRPSESTQFISYLLKGCKVHHPLLGAGGRKIGDLISYISMERETYFSFRVTPGSFHVEREQLLAPSFPPSLKHLLPPSKPQELWTLSNCNCQIVKVWGILSGKRREGASRSVRNIFRLDLHSGCMGVNA